MSCAALFAVLFSGMTIADLDRGRVYEIPSTMMEKVSLTQRLMAKSCAIRHGIRWKIVER